MPLCLMAHGRKLGVQAVSFPVERCMASMLMTALQYGLEKMEPNSPPVPGKTRLRRVGLRSRFNLGDLWSIRSGKGSLFSQFHRQLFEQPLHTRDERVSQMPATCYFETHNSLHPTRAFYESVSSLTAGDCDELTLPMLPSWRQRGMHRKVD